MGFSYFEIGCIQPCRITNGFVERQLPSGEIERFATRLNIEIPWQTNLFSSPNILFYLKQDGREYIGRKDGSISVYTIDDDLLVGLNNWDAPQFPMLYICGYKVFGNYHVNIYQDKHDLRSLYASYVDRYSCALPERVDPIWDLDKAEIGWVLSTTFGEDFIFTGRGDKFVKVDRWEVQSLLRSKDYRCFV